MAQAPAPLRRHRRLQRLLLAHYAVVRRPLAWRETTDPYRILVSEIMLQQTQAARVEPAFVAFCARFPDLAALAQATPADVLRAWQGLGYNRRALQLQRAAVEICAHHGGYVPDDLGALQVLPGIGPYTARAILVFAFGQDVAPVDTNVARVLSRAVAGHAIARAQLQQLADEMVPGNGAAADWSQALMDLGAGHCNARAPRCVDCPVRTACAWRGRTDTVDPAQSGGAKPRSQAPFAGSDRYHRGRLMDALRKGPVPCEQLDAATLADDAPRSQRLAEGLVAEGLAEWSNDRLQLPGQQLPAAAGVKLANKGRH